MEPFKDSTLFYLAKFGYAEAFADDAGALTPAYALNVPMNLLILLIVLLLLVLVRYCVCKFL